MKRTTIALIAVALVGPVLSAQPAGLMLGLDYHAASLQNPYVSYSGSIVEPTDLEEFADAADYLFFPFGYKAISEQGHAEVSTYAFNALLGYIGGVLSGRSTYEQYFRSDKESIFRPTLENDPDKLYFDQDLLRFAVSGAVRRRSRAGRFSAASRADSATAGSTRLPEPGAPVRARAWSGSTTTPCGCGSTVA